MQRHLGAAKYSLATQCYGPATINMKNLDQTSFPNRAVKTFSVATHLFRGIILNIGKSLRWGTSDFIKLSKWDYVRSLTCRPMQTCFFVCQFDHGLTYRRRLWYKQIQFRYILTRKLDKLVQNRWSQVTRLLINPVKC